MLIQVGGESKVEMVTHRFKLFWLHVTVIPFGSCGKQKAMKFTLGCGRHGPVLHRNQNFLFPLISSACASVIVKCHVNRLLLLWKANSKVYSRAMCDKVYP